MSEFQCAINTTSPPSPPAGTVSLYVKSDGRWYYKDAAGLEHTLVGTNGQSVHHTSLTAGTGAAGTTDTYTFWGDAGETISLGTYLVSNGANGSAGAGALQAANNLSDVQSAQTSLTNIGGLGNTSLINGGGF